MKYIIGMIALVILWYTYDAKKEKFMPLPAHPVILAVGDSLTYGYGAKRGEDYPTVLAKLTGFRVINGGVNGETSDEILKRLPDLLERHRPDITIICAGGNDILQRKSIDNLRANLLQMIAHIKQADSRPILLSVPHVTLFGLTPLSVYEEVAQATDTPLIEGVLAKILEDPDLKSDYIHPNAAGYRRLAQEIKKFLDDLIVQSE